MTTTTDAYTPLDLWTLSDRIVDPPDEEWVQKAQGARKANEAAKEKKLSGGVDMTK